MPKFTSFRLAALCSRWVRRGLCFVVLCSLSLSITVLQGPSEASLPPSQYAQSQTDRDIWATVASARSLYEAGNYGEALEHWQAIATGFEQRGDRPNQAMALSNLSLTYQELGKWDEANDAITTALTLLDVISESSNKSVLQVLAQSLDVRGKLAFVMGNSQTALDDWQHSEQVYSNLNNRLGYISSLLNQAQAYLVLGQYQQAEQRVQFVQEQMHTLSDNALKIAAGRGTANVQRLLGGLSEAEQTLFCLLGPETRRQLDLSITGLQAFRPSETSDDALVTADVLCADFPTNASNLELAPIVNEWGNVQAAIAQRAQDLGKRTRAVALPAEKALSAYTYAADLAAQSSLTVLHLQTQVNALNVLVRFQTEPEAIAPTKRIDDAITQLDDLLISPNLPVSQHTVYGRVNYAESLLRLAESSTVQNSKQLYYRAGELLGQATALAAEAELDDPRAMAYAVGRLGTLYRQVHQLEEARQLIERAIVIANEAQAPDIGYRWQRQLGKLLEMQAEEAEAVENWQAAEDLRARAIAAYRAALDTLETVRLDLLTVDSEIQFSFRDEVEPVYRDFIELLLAVADDNTEKGQKQINEALQSFDQLQLAEINNFLGCDSRQSIALGDVEDEKAGIIYMVILQDKIGVILDLPNHVDSQNPQRNYKLFFDERIPRQKTIDEIGTKVDIEKEIEATIEFLSSPGTRPDIIAKATELYDWLISPIVDDLEGLETLVFVPDGIIRNLPMHVLYDSENSEYLIEKYSVVLSPRIELFNPQKVDPNPHFFVGGFGGKQKIKGIDFEPIEQLQEELDDIVDLGFPAHPPITGAAFQSDTLKRVIQSSDFSVIHLKAHGVFSSEPEETFIAGNAEPILGRQLGNLMQSGTINEIQAIDLLGLSACKSAQGDNRAVLGLTGIAVRAGARSVISSLWVAQDSVNTAIMPEFYRQIYGEGKSRAKAFQDILKSLIRRPDIDRYVDQPHEWATYVLVGNWL